MSTVEASGPRVTSQFDQSNQCIGALGDRLWAAVAVEVGSCVSRRHDIDLDVRLGLGVLQGKHR